MNFKDDLLLILGKSKMEKIKSNFVLVDKETAYLIIKRVGTQGFTLWWYLWGRCYGDSRIHTYPKKETIVNDLIGRCSFKNRYKKEKWIMNQKRKVQRWMKLLEEENVLKRVPAFNKKGAQTVNVVVLNASFPEIPEGWNNLFEDGVLIENQHIKVRKDSRTLVENINIETDIPSSHLDRGRQKCLPYEQGDDINVYAPWTNLSRGVNNDNHWNERDGTLFTDGGIKKIKEKNKEDGWISGNNSKIESKKYEYRLFKDLCLSFDIDAAQGIELWKIFCYQFDNVPFPIKLKTLRELLQDKYSIGNGIKENKFRNLPGLFCHRMKSWESMYIAFKDIDEDQKW